ncbi:LUD domain-containing protein [Streptomyces sp. Q6]|uniref:LUD domain-containing protein n=1 Tax=Streptomyces citrinus TaxID=3118173 RepID=A0ACD5AJY0_9ACTN
MTTPAPAPAPAPTPTATPTPTGTATDAVATPARVAASGTAFAVPATADRLERAAAALTAHGFTVEIVDDVAAARARVAELIPAGASVFTGASETLRLSGIEDDINTGGRYDAVKPRLLAMDRATQGDEIRRLSATPDVVVASAHAVTETGSLVIASGSGSQLPSAAGGAARALWVVGAQKIVPDLDTALRRVEAHCLPLENERAQRVYGMPSAVNRLLVLNAEYVPGRGTVVLLREPIGF